MPALEDLQKDPKFMSLSPEAKRIVLSKKDEKFGALSPEAQNIVVGRFSETKSSPGRAAEIASKIYRPVLEIGGGIGGGVLGAGATSATIAGVPAGTVAGGVLGYAAGKGAANRLDEAFGLKEPPRTMAEGAREVGASLGEGAIAEATGFGAGKILSRAAKAAGPIVERAKRFAVDLTPAEITQSKPFALLESVLEKTPFSAGIVQKFRVKQGQQLERAAQELIEELGAKQGKEAVGTGIQAAIEAKHFKRLAVRDKLFDRLTSKIKPDVVIGSENLNKRAEDLLLNEFQLPKEAQNEAVSTFLNGMTKVRQQGLTFQGAKSLRERLSAMVGPSADTPEKLVYKRVKNALDEDIAAFADAQGGEVAKSWKKANAFHGAVKQLADDPSIKSVLNKANPSAIADSLLNSKNTLQVRLLRKAMPDKDFQKLQSAVVDRLFEGGVNRTAASAMETNLKRYGDEFLEVAITKPKLNRLKEFAEVVGAAKKAEKMAGNPSGTAQNVISAGLGAFVITNPVKGTIAVVAPPVLARMYLSDFGKKLITEGVRLSPRSARAAGVASAIMALSKKEENKGGQNAGK